MSSNLLIAPIEALMDPDLGDQERRVLLSLFSFRNKLANTVWPGLDQLCERSNIKDPARVSKVTSSLAKKGWLTKRKKGFTGGNEYSLTVPDRLTNLAPDTKLAQDANTNLANYTKSNLAESAKYKEQQIEQQIEQQHGKPKKPEKPSQPKLDPLPENVDPVRWSELLKIRTKKRASNTDHAKGLLLGKLARAHERGYDPNQIMDKVIERGWISFEIDWLDNAGLRRSATASAGGQRI